MNDALKNHIWKQCCDAADGISSTSEALRSILEARSRSEEAHVYFLLFLRAIETRREDLWKVNGISNFETWLQSNHVINVASYRNFCVTAGMLSSEDLVKIGAEAANALSKFSRPSPEAIQKFVERCEAFRAVNGVAPSEQTSQRWVRELEQRDPRVVASATRMAELVEENVLLKKRLQQAISERDALRKKIEKLEAKLSGMKRRQDVDEPAS